MAFSFTSPSSGAPVKKSNVIWGIVIFVLLVLVLGGGCTYNSMVSKQEAVDRALGIYVNAVHEAYPDLKANENFKDLQVQLEGTENRISTARIKYNDAVMKYNVAIRRFPANIFAGLFGFNTMQGFQAEAGAQKAVTVSFDD